MLSNIADAKLCETINNIV